MRFLKGHYDTFLDLFFQARREIVVSFPGVSEEIAYALLDRAAEGIMIKAYIEMDELVFRSGFGDAKAVDILKAANIPLFTRKNFNFYFLLVDDTGYFYFPKSRFQERQGDSFDLFPMTEKQVKQIKLHFNLLDDEDSRYDDLIEEAGIEQLTAIHNSITEIDEKKTKQILENLKNSPPLKPDMGRTLETYKAKYQIVELSFRGSQLKGKKVSLPESALPFRDKELRQLIEARLRLFEDVENMDFLKPFDEIMKEFTKLRNDFLYHLKSRDKNILKQSQKEDFENRIKKIESSIDAAKEEILNNLQKEIIKARNRIRNTLIEFLLDNPPENLKGLETDILIIEIENIAGAILTKIKFPMARDLLENIEINYHYYDLTWSDLNNEEVLEDMIQFGLITSTDKAYIENLGVVAKREI